MTRRPWETPFAVTRPVFVAVAGLVATGMVAVLGGAAVREHTDRAFRPDWAVWAPVTVAIGLGVLGLALLAALAQRLPPKPMTPAEPLLPPVADGTERALLAGEPLTAEQRASLPDLVARQRDRRQLWILALGPMYLIMGGVGAMFGRDPAAWAWYPFAGVVWTAAGVLRVRRRRRILDRAAALGADTLTGRKPATDTERR